MCLLSASPAGMYSETKDVPFLVWEEEETGGLGIVDRSKRDIDGFKETRIGGKVDWAPKLG